MIIYKVVKCKKCETYLELQYDEIKKEYTGVCPICNIEIKSKTVGDEESILKRNEGK